MRTSTENRARTSIEKRRIAYSIAVPQHGVVARRQLLSAGLSSGIIDHWSSVGTLIAIFRAVYALGRPVVRDEALWMAAVLAGGRRAALTGKAAAAAWGFGDSPTEIEVIRPEGRSRRMPTRSPHGTVMARIHRGDLDRNERHQIGPLPVAGPDRILADLAGQTTDLGLRRYFLDAGRFGFLPADRLDLIRNSTRRYPGRPKLMRLVELWDPNKGDLRSHMEAEFRLMCAEQAVPLPETNRKIGRDEVDAVWWDARLVVELDSRQFHSDPIAQQNDAEKTRRLRADGYLVLRFTWEEITGSPETVARRILCELELRAPALLRR